MMRALGRVILLPIAFVLSAVAALFVIFSLGQERVVQAISSRPEGELQVEAIMDMLAFVLRFTSLYTILPALLLVIVGEAGRIRSAIYYIVGGGIALALVPLLTRMGQPATALDVSPVVWQVLATAGFAGGFIYWLLAGRTA